MMRWLQFILLLLTASALAPAPEPKLVFPRSSLRRYDTAWNLNYRTNSGALSTFRVDGKNQLTSSPGGSCTYDNNGNMTISHGERRSYVYDDENRLVELYVSTSPLVLQNAIRVPL